MTIDQLTQFGVVYRAIREVGTQREQDNDRTMRLGGGGHQQIEEVAPIILRWGLSEEFLELVYQQHHFCPRSFCELRGKQVQTARCVVFQVFTNPSQALVGQKL